MGWIDEIKIYDTALSEENLLFLSEGETYKTIPDPARETDLTTDGIIDLADFANFMGQWLLCNDPQDPACFF